MVGVAKAGIELAVEMVWHPVGSDLVQLFSQCPILANQWQIGEEACL
jgi:hypothetical protein